LQEHLVKLLTKDQLTDDQKEALQYMHDFIEGPNREMVLRGPAGTGKTSLVNVLLAELDKAKFYEYICTATTNKAVEVISRNTGREFDRTIYSLEGLTVKDDDDRGARLVREPGVQSKLKDYDLIIVDEASMVPLQLIQEIEYDLLEHSRPKVIYIGDPCQLPPVPDKQLGLNESMVFQLPLWFELTKVMRTALDNPILKLVTGMREDMTTEGDRFEYTDSLTEEGDGVRFYDNRRKFMETMYEHFTSEEYRKDTDYCMAVAWRNISADAINEKVVRRVYPGISTEYAEGEEVRTDIAFRRPVPGKKDVFYPVYTMEERLKILEIEEDTDPKYELECYKVTVCNFRALPKNRTTTVAYILKKSSIEKYNILLTEKAAECKQREKEPGHDGKGHLYSKKEAWAPYNDMRMYYLWVDHIFAMTTHRAQGTTVQNVFVVERDMNFNPDVIERNKLKYTAFTRAAKRLHVLI
jgi:hypothetical protein